MNKQFFLTLLLAFSVLASAQMARPASKFQQQQKMFNGMWQIDAIGNTMYFNVLRLTVVAENQLTIEVMKNYTSAIANGGKVSVVSFNGKRLIIRIIGDKYWNAKGNIALDYDGETFYDIPENKNLIRSNDENYVSEQVSIQHYK